MRWLLIQVERRRADVFYVQKGEVSSSGEFRPEHGRNSLGGEAAEAVITDWAVLTDRWYGRC